MKMSFQLTEKLQKTTGVIKNEDNDSWCILQNSALPAFQSGLSVTLQNVLSKSARLLNFEKNGSFLAHA